MASGIGALQSAVSRVKKKILPHGENKISVVVMNKDGTIDFPENCNDGLLVVPVPVTEEDWEADCGS